MSPEQAAGRTATAQSDIYSLGVVAYELLTGKAPYEGDSPLLILNKIQNSEPQWPRSINPDIPVDLENIVRKMMARNPSERYASCQEIIQDTRKINSGQPVSLRRERSPAFRRIGVALAAMAVVAAVILVAVFAAKGIGPDGTPPPVEPKAGAGVGSGEISVSRETGRPSAKAPDVESEDAEAAHAPSVGEKPEASAPESAQAREEDWDIPTLEGPEEIEQALAVMEEKLKGVRRQYSRGEREAAEYDFGIFKDKFDLVTLRMEAFQNDMYPDIIVLKSGKRKAEEMSVKIAGESIENVRIDTASLRRRQEIPRSQILTTVYAPEEESRLADELLQIKKRVDKLRKDALLFQNTLSPSAGADRPEPVEPQDEDEPDTTDEDLDTEEDDPIDERLQEELGDWADDIVEVEPDEEYVDKTDYFAD
jgi:hypothetical protein